MKVCPLCKASGACKCIDTRAVGTGEATRRRYKCTTCMQRFTTFEVVMDTAQRPVKSPNKHLRALGKIAASRIVGDAASELDFDKD